MRCCCLRPSALTPGTRTGQSLCQICEFRGAPRRVSLDPLFILLHLCEGEDECESSFETWVVAMAPLAGQRRLAFMCVIDAKAKA